MKLRNKINSLKVSSYMMLILVATACSLKEVPVDFFESNTFYKDDNSLVQGVNGCYEVLRSDTYYGNVFTTAIFASADYGMGSTGQNSIEDFTKATLTTEHRFVKNIWAILYDGIGRANAVITRATNATGVNEMLRARVLGEARFLRALHYFNLVRCYGNVPLRKEMITGFADDQINIPLSTHKQIFKFIIDDLAYAEQNCWNRNEIKAGFTNDIGRATSLAATILLAKVYLQIASSARVYHTGQTDNGITEINDLYKDFTSYQAYYDSCIQVCDRGLAAPDFALEAVWARLWDIDQNKNSKEFVFAVQNSSADGYGSRYPGLYLPKDCILGGSAGTTGGINRILKEFIMTDVFDTTDLRVRTGMLLQVDFRDPATRSFVWEWRDKKKAMIARYVYKDSVNAAGATIAAKGITGLYVKKWTDSKTKDVNTSRTDFPVIRSVDLYLMKAEAIAELSENPSAAYPMLTLLRGRASAKVMDNTFLNQFAGATPMDKFRELILRERLTEFATEGDRWFSLKRLGKLMEKGQKVVEQGNAFKSRKKSDYYWPLSQDELNSNRAINPNANGGE